MSLKLFGEIMENTYWSSGIVLDKNISQRLLKAMLFKFFYNEEVYRYPIYNKKTGEKSNKTELRLNILKSNYIFIERDNVFNISRSIFLNNSIDDMNFFIFRTSEKIFRRLRCINGFEIRDFFLKKINQSKNYDASYDFYEDLGNNLYLFDTTFSWCIHIYTEEIYESLDLMDIYIYIKVLNFEKMPKFMKRYKEFLIKK